MNIVQALILGIVQGITEFFPISSSAHLRIAKKCLGILDGEHLLYFDLLCHAGTLLALMIYLRKEIFQAFLDFKQIQRFFIALIPLIPGYFLLKPLRIALSDPAYLGVFLMASGAFLLLALKKQVPQSQKWKNVLWIGMAQTAALIPGISRSGSTVGMARLCGWSWEEAAKFSFLLAIPTILGGEVLETIKLLKGSSEPLTEPLTRVSTMSYATGFIASFGVGLISVRAVFWIYRKEMIAPIAWYCIGIGLLALGLFHG